MALRSEITQQLALAKPLQLTEDFANYACVAALLRGESWEQLELAYIRRTTRELDRWSGQVAFPGGKAESFDANDLATAIRETREEIGFELKPAECVGALDDLQARKSGQLLDFFIRPFVFYVEREVSLSLGESEVADFFWVPIADLRHAQNQTHWMVAREHSEIQLPAIQLKTEPPLWGLTYMMTQNLLRILPFPK